MSTVVGPFVPRFGAIAIESPGNWQQNMFLMYLGDHASSVEDHCLEVLQLGYPLAGLQYYKLAKWDRV